MAGLLKINLGFASILAAVTNSKTVNTNTSFLIPCKDTNLYSDSFCDSYNTRFGLGLFQTFCVFDDSSIDASG